MVGPGFAQKGKEVGGVRRVPISCNKEWIQQITIAFQ